jgi:hypothetical protein
MVHGFSPSLQVIKRAMAQKGSWKFIEKKVACLLNLGKFAHIDKLANQKPGGSSVEPSFSDDLKPDGREQ